MTTLEPNRRTTLLAFAAIALVAGWLALFTPGGGLGNLERRLVIGFLLGTSYAHATLAALTTALGSGRLVVRLPLCLVWVASLGVPWAVHFSQGGPGDLALFFGSMAGQWLLAAGLLAVLRWFTRVAIRDPNQPGTTPFRSPLQFGIRQLMILTAAVAVFLGAGRVLAPVLVGALTWGRFHEAPAFAFVVATNVLLTLPLALAVLLPSRAVIACGVGLAFAVLASLLEFSLLGYVAPGGQSRLPMEVIAMLSLMNFMQVGWSLGVLGLVRAAGYRLMTPGSPPLAAGV